MSNTAKLDVEGKRDAVELSQSTSYPWNGDIDITVDKNKIGEFTMKVRVPGWVRNMPVPSDLYSYSDNLRPTYSVKVNGQPVEATLNKGYFDITRRWKKGDRVSVHFDMLPRTVKANAKVEADRGRVAVERGPIVYCAEWPDNDFDVLSVLVNQKPEFKEEVRPDMLHGITELVTDGQVLSFNDKGALEAKDVRLTLIPYYAWNHRGPGKMAVWLPQNLSASRPAQPATLASAAKVSSSHKMAALSAINDGLVPKDENDRSVPYFHYWPKQDTSEWLVYEFPKAETVQSSTVYWYDDGPWGGCRVPREWKLYYRDDKGDWQPVTFRNELMANPGATTYPVVKGAPCKASFDPVTTDALKLEIRLPADNATGLFEWQVN